MVKRLGRLVVRSASVLRNEGLRVFVSRVFLKLGSRLQRFEVRWLVAAEDAALVDWTVRPEPLRHPVVVASGPIEIAWISSPPGPESGGHQNLFRFIRFAEEAGHRCTVYIYDQNDTSIDSVRSMLEQSSAYPALDAEIVRYRRESGVAPHTQALFASGWETAYPAYLDRSRARRFYFVQDFEPTFYPVGSEHLLAENTYRFGFHGITAGGWLARKLREEYGMTTDSFDFAVDAHRYHVTNTASRNEIFFYARPVTPRRAFELGVLALRDFHTLRPDVTINLAGWDVSNWDIPFPYRNHAALDVSELNALYNRCAAGLVLSLTNMSLLPLELLSSGTTAVVNDAPNNRQVFDNAYIAWVPPSPLAIAKRLVEIVDRSDHGARALEMAASVQTTTWEDSGAQFIQALERAMRG